MKNFKMILLRFFAMLQKHQNEILIIFDFISSIIKFF